MGLTRTRSDLLAGARFGQHEVVRLIGHGATATVFEARHVTLGKRVALKVLHDHLAADEQVSGRFVREGRVAAQLRHPNVLDVIDVGVENGMPYLVMELLQGQDLRAVLAERGALPLQEALGVLLPIASALAHAHDAGAIHRDLKPANIFLAKDARGEIVPKLVDFGLSKLVGDGEDRPLTQTDTVVGTMLYMAPEQTRGGKNAGPKSDQYALAAILYESLLGKAPFEGDGFYGLLEAIQHGFAAPPSLVDPRLPEALDAILLRALSRDPARRHASVRAFARELTAFAGERVAATWGKDFVEDGGAAPPPVASDVRVVSARASSQAAAASSAETSVGAPYNPLPCAPGTSPFRMKGLSFRGLMHFVEKAVPGGIEALAAAFEDPRLRPFVRQQFLPSARYDVLPIGILAATVARLIGKPFEEFVRIGTYGQARYDASTVFKRLYDGCTIDDLPKKFPRFGAQYYDFGACRATMLGPGHLLLEHEGIPAYLYRWFRPMHAAYTEETARILGVKAPEVTPRAASSAGSRGVFELVTGGTDLRWT